ncbi:restriction endonuclease [Thermotoga sp. KOL6]|uniref:restriction endonuclease n=1 Tax=Thermotoga sp. KOL6 TaxID=126741 RepID=UPI000C76923D|nr:restriction endonuclease [Thermotoga sp. KOL6]PLV59735.1 restriction endonuclease [Thermotoga sp. KOL6]
MKYLILSLLLFSFILWIWLSKSKKKKERLKDLLRKGLKNPYQFEMFAREYLRENGFKSVKTTRKSKDFGADIVAKRHGRTVVFQVKMRSSVVEKSVVKELIAAAYIYGATEVGIFTNTEISKGLERELKNLEVLKGFIKRVHIVKNVTLEEV